MKEFDVNNIFVDVEAGQTKPAALAQMAALIAEKNGLDEAELVRGFNAREAESTTGFGNGVAIPHTKVKGLSQPIVAMATFKNEVEWASLDEAPVTIAIALVMPLADDNQEHLKVLSKFARKLMDDTFIHDLQINSHNAAGLYEVVTAAINFN